MSTQLLQTTEEGHAVLKVNKLEGGTTLTHDWNGVALIRLGAGLLV